MDTFSNYITKEFLTPQERGVFEKNLADIGTLSLYQLRLAEKKDAAGNPANPAAFD